MDKNIERARELLPAILITVLSMIQALALEIYWTKAGDSVFLWQGGWEAVIGWLQMLAAFMGILLIWLLYVSTVLRFTWLPTLEDTIVPFFIGLCEFALIDMLGPESLGVWFMILAATFAVSIIANHMVMRRARQDPANAYFFDEMAPARWRDHVRSFIVVAILVVCGALLGLSDSNPVLSVVALLLALVVLAQQFWQCHRFWMHSMELLEQKS